MATDAELLEACCPTLHARTYGRQHELRFLRSSTLIVLRCLSVVITYVRSLVPTFVSALKLSRCVRRHIRAAFTLSMNASRLTCVVRTLSTRRTASTRYVRTYASTCGNPDLPATETLTSYTITIMDVHI